MDEYSEEIMDVLVEDALDDIIKTPLNLKAKNKSTRCRSVDYETNISKQDATLVGASLLQPEPEVKEGMLLTGEVTSIDFMMPEEERQILEENINLYSNMEQMQKVLSVAQKNKKLSEDIKTLQLISKTGKFSEQMLDLMSKEDNLKVLEKYMQRKFEEGDIAKAYKEVGTVTKIMMDAREQMVKSLSPKRNGKTKRIDLKFTNESGDEFQIGVEG